MRRSVGVLAGTVVAALACGTGGDDGPPAGEAWPVTPPAEVAPAEVAPAPAAAASGVPDPLAGKSLAEICSDDSLALIRWDYVQLAGDYHELCCGPGKLEDDIACELDWPFSDVPDCSEYDRMRNAIFARYGYPFTKKEWQDEFGKQPWYVRRDDFQESWLSERAKKNVERLVKMRDEKTGCMNY